MRVIHILRGEAAALHADLVVLADAGHAGIERFAAGLLQEHRDAGVGARHGDAASHGAGADDRDLCDRVHRGVPADARHFGRGALREEGTDQGFGLVGCDTGFEEFALSAAARIEWHRCGGFDRFDSAQRRDLIAANLRCEFAACGIE
jgi:hypothetical protein